MHVNKFSKGEAIKYGWNTMKQWFWPFAGIVLIQTLVSWLPQLVIDETADIFAAYILFSVIIFILETLISMGITKIALGVIDNQEFKFADLFSAYPLFFKYLLGGILYGLIVCAGLILLVIPGIIWGIRFRFYFYLIIDKNLGPIEALKTSWKITKGSAWNLFLFELLLVGIIIIGFLALFVGIFAAIPTMWLALAFAYRKFVEKSDSVF